MHRAPRFSFALTMALLAALFHWGCTAADETRGTQDAGQAVYVGKAMIRPYRPRSTLVTPVTTVDQARFPAIDFHCHWTNTVEPELLLAAMDRENVAYAVNLSGGFGDDLHQMLDRYVQPGGGRLIVFANIDFSRIDDSDFGRDAVLALEEARARGAGGLKIFKSLGLTIRDKSGQLVPIDDPRIDPVWEACARLGMPVLIHAADPIAFFQPVDEHNERWMQLRRYPNWSFLAPQFPEWADIIAQRNRMIARHRDVTFVVAHLAEAGNDLATLGRWLDENPNMSVDLSGRMNEIGRQPRRAREFFIQYADRILFGTDRYPGRNEQPRYHLYFRMLETADEYFDYYDHPFPPAGEWKVYGLDLPDDVLEKVYRGNALRILGLMEGGR